MALTGEQAYALSKKTIQDITQGITMIEGKPCTIASITEITGGHRVTYRWTANDGTTKTQTMDVMDGVQGPQGVKGDTGNTGATGAQGPAGADGTSATIRVGNVTSGATPTITNSGTNLNAVFDFVLPKGDKGDKGDKGEDGQNGSSFSIRSRFATYEELIAAYPDGPENEGDAYFVGTTASPDLYIWLVDEHEWHNNGPIAGVKGDKGDQGDEGFSPVANVTKDGGVATITIRDKTGTTTQQVSDGADGDDGQDGADGKSAYDIAVDEGFVGTKAEWLASLKGETGAAGTNGTNGTDGVSPVANVTKTDDVIKIHIEDSTGTTEEEIDISDYASKQSVEDIQEVIPSDASASNKLVTSNDTSSTTLTSTNTLASWVGNAKGVMTAFIGTSSKPSDIGSPLSSWGETMIWCIGDGIRKTLFAIDFSVTQHVIYTREYYNGSFITNWTAIKDGNLTSSVTSGSTAPITSGGCYDYLAGSPLIGQVTTTLGRLGFGTLADNFLEIKVCPSSEITNNPFGDSGNCLYIKMGIVEFVVGALSADASQWTPNTGVAYRVRHGSVWQSWHTLTQN